ncbi:MAG: hypothetical protein Q3997_03120 [Propionibacteriaceae bacterium]|nr:hypothetical protein [Propionibacteriaceae bacterium]
MSKRSSFGRSLAAVASASALSLAISILTLLLIPKVMPVDDFGYWQLYIFYLGYAGFAHLGMLDGLYLEYGGRQLDDLPQRPLRGQFAILTGLQVGGALVLVVLGTQVGDPNHRLVLFSTALGLVAVNLRMYFMRLLQAVGKLKHYAVLMVTDRLLFIVTVVGLLVFKQLTVERMLAVDVAARFVVLLLAFVMFRSLALGALPSVREAFTASRVSIGIGLPLLASGVANLLVPGFMRISIERGWPISEFGKTSLALSVLGLLTTLIATVGTTLFPELRRMDAEQQLRTYRRLRSMILTLGLLILPMYYVAALFIMVWLPQYHDSVLFLALLFPAILFETRTNVINIPFCNALRKERQMLLANLTGCLLSAGLAVAVFAIRNLELAMALIGVLMAIQCYLLEIPVRRKLQVGFPRRDLGVELVAISIFVASLLLDSALLGFAVACCGSLLGLALRGPAAREDFGFIAQLVKRARPGTSQQ